MKKISTIFVIGVSLILLVACNAQNNPTVSEKELSEMQKEVQAQLPQPPPLTDAQKTDLQSLSDKNISSSAATSVPNVSVSKKKKKGLLSGLYWCDESYEKRKNEFIINKDNQPEGSVVVEGHLVATPQTYLDNKQYDILVLTFTSEQSNQALFNRFSNQRTSDENAKITLGSIENGRLVSTGQLDKETNDKLMNALESGKSISLKLGFNGYPQETGVPPQFTKACKIEAL